MEGNPGSIARYSTECVSGLERHDWVVAVAYPLQAYLIIPLVGVQRVSYGEPIPMDFEIRGLAGITE